MGFGLCPSPVAGQPGDVHAREFPEGGLVRIMTMGAQQVEFFPVPLSDPTSVDADSPVAENAAMALSAEPIRFFERNLLAGDELQIVSFLKAVAVETPHPVRMVKVDIPVHANENPRLWIRQVQVGTEKGIAFLQPTVEPPDIFLMARLTRVKTLVDKGRGHWKLLGLIICHRCGFFPIFNGMRSIDRVLFGGRTGRKEQTQQDGGDQEPPCLFQRGDFRHHGLQTERCFNKFKSGASIRLSGTSSGAGVRQLGSIISLLIRTV